jgi:hypothetical protein
MHPSCPFSHDAGHNHLQEGKGYGGEEDNETFRKGAIMLKVCSQTPPYYRTKRFEVKDLTQRRYSHHTGLRGHRRQTSK